MSSPNITRVLHLPGCLGVGGIETWLLNIMRRKPTNLCFDFLVVDGCAMDYAEEFEDLGAKIYRYPKPKKLKQALKILGVYHYPSTLDGILTQNRYDVVHAHGEWSYWPALKIAAQRGVPIRIAHSHGAFHARTPKTLKRKLLNIHFKTIDYKLMHRYATDLVACSQEAGLANFGSYWEASDKRLIFCGVPLNKFIAASAINKDAIRNELGIPADAIIVGHVGNKNAAKNHSFIVRVFNELAKRSDKYRLLMVGAGGKTDVVDKLVRRFGLESRVVLPGIRGDVPALMIHAMDVFLFPSLWEGLPVTALEATAAGLFTVCSNTITKDYVDYFKDRCEAISLDADYSFWADRVEEAVKKRISADEGIKLVGGSHFSLDSSLESLLKLYRYC